MNITDLNVPLILVGTIVLAAVKIALSLGKFKQSINSKIQGLEYANETQNKNIADLKEDFEYITNALDKKIEHRDARLSGSITQIQNYLEKQGVFVRRDPLYDGLKKQKSVVLGVINARVQKDDLVLLNLMVYVDGEGSESAMLEATSKVGDNVAHFYEVVKPDQPEYQNLLEQWEKGTKLKKEVKESLKASMDKAQGN